MRVTKWPDELLEGREEDEFTTAKTTLSVSWLQEKDCRRRWIRLHRYAPCPYRYAKALRAWKHCGQGMADGGENAEPHGGDHRVACISLR